MPNDLPKAYDPTAIEDHWAEYWVREKLFTQPPPEKDAPKDADSFVILLPPPNVTGRLHMGHMLNQTEMDILTRWQRMRGRKALWLPGTDHAGIATQMMVERQLAEEGKKRQDMGRDAFVKRVWEWKKHYGGAILDQMKRLGASVDWSREYFTMDDKLSVAVRVAFVKLYEQDLIYRGAYIVNWCPRCQTAISDLEVVYDEHQGHLWEIKYPVLNDDRTDSDEFLTIATTRPETMLGDVAVAVHPDDERYTHLHGKRLRLPVVNRIIPIVLDDYVSREFGTGAVKVTPAHDPNDFAIGQRHNLPTINVMDETAKITGEGGRYKGLDRYIARKRIIAELEQEGLLVAVKDHVHNVGHCDRCKTVVEPRLSLQWFIKIQPLADKAIAAVKEGHIKFTPEMYEKTYLNWMENIHDWCISRQLWWGHRIPAWECSKCHKTTVARKDPTQCSHCGAEEITQSTDVLDTWFSSGLLPVSVFGWPNITPENRADFDAFYPTSLLVTGFDILFFWVARMIMLGCWFASDVPTRDGSPVPLIQTAPPVEAPAGDAASAEAPVDETPKPIKVDQRSLAQSVPFREVYIHALVRDANREKMSKTKGNVIDPIEIVKQYGTDAVRFTLASMASPGTDIAFNTERTEGYRAFANKIWNAARFIFMNVDKAAEAGIKVDPAVLGSMPKVSASAPLEERWIVAELQSAVAKVNESLTNYRYDDAANTIYQFFWGSFCDWYLEIVKLRLDFSETADKAATTAALTTLVSVFEAALRLLSPFMPFLTEELWKAVYNGETPAKSIALSRYPQCATAIDKDALNSMDLVQKLIVEIRALRKDSGVEEKALTPVEICTDSIYVALFVQADAIVERLARVSEVKHVAQISLGLAKRHHAAFEVGIPKPQINVAAERERLTKDIAKYEKGIAAADRQLGNEGFLAKAPAHVVEGLKKQHAETTLLLEKAQAALAALPPEETAKVNEGPAAKPAAEQEVETTEEQKSEAVEEQLSEELEVKASEPSEEPANETAEEPASEAASEEAPAASEEKPCEAECEEVSEAANEQTNEAAEEAGEAAKEQTSKTAEE
ncbi:MAG: valine--tRNA ligase [Acidobacteriota bacterium]|nr:valine--tRNA ligase [Acidobacteriota bacterium]